MVLALFAVLLAAGGRDKNVTEMPLQLAVRTPEDLAFKAVAERQYLIFNLLASGKLAWDRGDFATAASKWETLLQIAGLDPEVERAVRPLAVEARSRAGGKAAKPTARSEPDKSQRTVTVDGLVSGGGARGPAGAVITLRRTDGDMPPPATVAGAVVSQQGKAFLPHVLAIPVGTTVLFRNDDPINHDVFSLSPAAGHFNTGLFGRGGERSQRFDKAGVVELLCDIHSAMLGYVVVVDTPYYATADSNGAFQIRGVRPGEYEVEAWHESAKQPARQKVNVKSDGARVELTVAGDRQPPSSPPNKAGKPRQSEFGY
jgi:plastocyanin